MLQTFNAVSSEQLQLKYVKAYVAVATEGSFFNVAKLFPRKAHTYLVAPVDDVKRWLERLEEAGLEAELRKGNKVRVHLKLSEFESSREVVEEFIEASVKAQQVN